MLDLSQMDLFKVDHDGQLMDDDDVVPSNGVTLNDQ